MDLDALGAAATAVVVLLAGAWNGWQSHKARLEAKRAADNAHPVSNGWGTKVAADLTYLREHLDRAHLRMDEQARRHNTTDQRLAEASGYARSAAEQSSAVATGLANHLADHASEDTKDVRLEVVTK